MRSDDIRGAKAQERLSGVAATVVDAQAGTIQSHIILARGTRILVALFAVILLAILGLMVIVYLNSWKINQLEIKVDEGNTQNLNR